MGKKGGTFGAGIAVFFAVAFLGYLLGEATGSDSLPGFVRHPRRKVLHDLRSTLAATYGE